MRRPRGTNDRLPEAHVAWQHVVDTFTHECDLRGFKPISTPTIEHTDLFSRTTGEETDIVRKEMYSFEDRGGDSLTLRPEGTAPVVRAYLQNGMQNLPQPVKVAYVASVFRYDRPQAGRYREHHQIGAEALGDANAAVDAEIINLLWSTYQALGISDLQLNINSLGDPDTRPKYREALIEYFTPLKTHLDPDSLRQLATNPLRLLDSKNPAVIALGEDAPRSVDFLNSEAQEHFEDLKGLLDALDIPFTQNNRLVRGLDYYNRTVFEFLPPDTGSQSTIGGGGRYDYLAELIDGSRVPGVGFGSGIERVLLNMERLGQAPKPMASTSVYVAPLVKGAVSAALRISHELQRVEISTESGFGQASPRSHLRRANALTAEIAILIGEDELQKNVVAIKPLDGSNQIAVPRDQAVDTVRNLLKPST